MSSRLEVRRFMMLVAAVLGACGSSEDPLGPGPDASILVGRGAFDLGTGFDAGGPDSGVRDGSMGLDAGGADVGSDAGETDAAASCDSMPVVELTATEIPGRVAELDGRVVRIVGTVSTGAEICTDSPCPGGDVCCHRCRAPLILGGLILSGGPCSGTSTIACVGGRCDPLVCSPPALGTVTGYEGVVRDGPEPALELLRIEP